MIRFGEWFIYSSFLLPLTPTPASLDLLERPRALKVVYSLQDSLTHSDVSDNPPLVVVSAGSESLRGWPDLHWGTAPGRLHQADGVVHVVVEVLREQPAHRWGGPEPACDSPQ